VQENKMPERGGSLSKRLTMVTPCGYGVLESERDGEQQTSVWQALEASLSDESQANY
jgi:hypothetical protein